MAKRNAYQAYRPERPEKPVYRATVPVAPVQRGAVSSSLARAKAFAEMATLAKGPGYRQAVQAPKPAVRVFEPVTLSKRMEGRPALHASQAGKFFPERSSRNSVVVLDEEKQLAATRPGRSLNSANRSALADKGVDLMHDQAACRREHRPESNKGDGSGRPFVPWCEKHK